MSFEIKDLTGLGAPITKLIEVLGAGFGTLYRPRAIRLEAVAQAKALALIGDAETSVMTSRKNALALADAQRPQFKLASEVLDERVTERLTHRETKRQDNLEAIASAAAAHLPEQVSKEPVDEDWKTRFFTIAEDVSNSDMQDLWGKVLAGEVARPGAFSLRSLETLRNLSQHEAELFRRLRYLTADRGILKVSGNDLSEFGITFEEILDLRAAGLVADGELSLTFALPEATKWLAIEHNGALILLEPQTPEVKSIIFEAFVLTSVGIELKQLIKPELNINYLTKLAIASKDKCSIYLGSAGQAREAFKQLGNSA